MYIWYSSVKVCTFDWLSFKIKSTVWCYTKFFIWFSQSRHFYKLDTCFIWLKGSHKSLRSCVKMLMGEGGLIDCIVLYVCSHIVRHIIV